MIDMDGTVYHGSRPIPGAVDFIASLRSHGIPFLFLTNNSCHPRSHYVDRLRSMGFDVSPDEILTSVVATTRYLLDNRPGARVYPLASAGVAEEMASAGVNIVDSEPDIVLLTFDRTMTYDKINAAYRFLVDGAELMATNPDDTCPAEVGYDIDLGPFIRMFEQMCDRRALVIGKPNTLFLEMAADIMGVDPSDTVMVGDRLYTDMEVASRAGAHSILVLTGEATLGDLEASGLEPDHVLGSVADIPPLFDRRDVDV